MLPALLLQRGAQRQRAPPPGSRCCRCSPAAPPEQRSPSSQPTLPPPRATSKTRSSMAAQQQLLATADAAALLAPAGRLRGRGAWPAGGGAARGRSPPPDRGGGCGSRITAAHTGIGSATAGSHLPERERQTPAAEQRADRCCSTYAQRGSPAGTSKPFCLRRRSVSFRRRSAVSAEYAGLTTGRSPVHSLIQLFGPGQDKRRVRTTHSAVPVGAAFGKRLSNSIEFSSKLLSSFSTQE